MSTLEKTETLATQSQAEALAGMGGPFAAFFIGMIVMGLIWFVYRRKSSATIKTLNTELTISQSSLNALSASYDELEKDAAEDRRLRTVAEERLAESEEARKADSDAAQTMISELRDSPRIDDKAAAIAKKTIEGLEAENGKLAAKLEKAESDKPAGDAAKIESDLARFKKRWAHTSKNWQERIDRKVKKSAAK